MIVQVLVSHIYSNIIRFHYQFQIRNEGIDFINTYKPVYNIGYR